MKLSLLILLIYSIIYISYNISCIKLAATTQEKLALKTNTNTNLLNKAKSNSKNKVRVEVIEGKYVCNCFRFTYIFPK